LRKQPAGVAHPRFQDFAGIDHGAAVGEALGEAAADRRGQRHPFVVWHQRAEAKIGQRVVRAGQNHMPHMLGNLHVGQCHGPLHRHATEPLTSAHFFLPNERKVTILVPSRTSAAICVRGTFFIWPAQRSMVSTNSSSA
jgi:hypothetical protein